MSTEKKAVSSALSKKGTESGKHLRAEAAKEEKKVEKRKGSDLKKGPERFEERAKSAGGGLKG